MQRALEIDQLRVLCESLGNARTKLQPAQLAVEFGTMGLQSVQGGRKEDENDGKLTPNLISQALTVKRGILASARSVEILLQLEADYGTRSPFHQMARLHVMSTKPSTPALRDWAMECLYDGLLNETMQLGDISKSSLGGDKHHVGLIPLYELKKKATRENHLIECKFVYFIILLFVCQVLDYLLDQHYPRAGLSEADRTLLKQKVMNHSTYRAHSGAEGDHSWMSKMAKSSIQAFHFLEASQAGFTVMLS